MFYEVQILAKFAVDGVAQERWIAISQFPKLLADAQLQEYLLRNKQCIVRWKPTDPSHIVADIN